MQIFTAGVVLYREDGRILLQHRDAHARAFPDMWGFFGGIMEMGEAPEFAMVRETREELGIMVREYRFSVTRTFLDDHGREHQTFLFVAPAEAQDPLVLGEGQGMGWFLRDEFQTIAIVPHCLETLVMIFEKEGWR